MSKSIFKNIIYKFALSFFNIIVPLLVTPYIASLFNRDDMTREAYGAYNDANSLLGFFLIFAVFGIYTYGVKEISRVRDDPKQVSATFTNLFLFSVITSIASSLLYIVFVFFSVDKMFYPTYYLMLIQLSGNILSIEWMNEAVENYGFITKKTIVVRIIYIISIFVFVRTPDDIIPYGMVMSLAALLNNLVSFIYIKRNIKFSFEEVRLKKYFKLLIPLMLISNVNILYSQLDKILIGRLDSFYPDVSKVIVTEYTTPANAINMIGVLLTSLLMVAVPRLSYYVSHDRITDYENLLDKSTRGFFLVLCPACIGLCCLSYEAMYIYTKGAYAYAYPVMQALSIRFLINSLYSIFSSQILYIWGRERDMVKILAIGGGLNLVFDLALMFSGNLTPLSAVISTTIAEIIMLTIMYQYIVRKTTVSFRLFRFSNLKYLLFSLPFFPIVYFVKSFELGILLNIVITVPICAGLYLALLVLTKDDMVFYLLNKIKLKLKGR